MAIMSNLKVNYQVVAATCHHRYDPLDRGALNCSIKKTFGSLLACGFKYNYENITAT